jgi:hypothetical protein
MSAKIRGKREQILKISYIYTSTVGGGMQVQKLKISGKKI